MGSRIWRLLSSVKAKNLTGLEIQKVASETYMDSSARQDLAQLRTVSNTADLFSFRGGIVWPDSMTTAAAALTNSAMTVIPSTLYADEADADTYMCQLLGIYAYVGSGTSFITGEWNDGTNSVVFVMQAVDGSNILTFRPSVPMYFTETMKIKITEAADNACNVRVAVGIISRGGAQ